MSHSGRASMNPRRSKLCRPLKSQRLTRPRSSSRLKALAVPGNPWFGSAGELVGMAYLKQGKPDLAGPLFASISRDKDTPETLRRRARQLAGLLGVDAIDDVAKAAAEQRAPAAPQ